LETKNTSPKKVPLDTITNSHPLYTLPSPNDKPVDILGLSLETPLEELAFPWLFPFGLNGFTKKKKNKKKINGFTSQRDKKK